MSTMYMPQTRKIFHMLGWAGAGLCAIVLILAVVIRVDQYLLRRKAERLLADLKSLEMRKSTHQDARQVIDRWKEEVYKKGPCEPAWCDVRISLGDVFERHVMFFTNHPRLVYLYQLLGGRPAMIDGFIRVRKNIVWGKGIMAGVASYFGRDQNGGWFFFSLIGQAGSGSPDFISALHPEYAVGTPSGCTFCKEAHVTFTPYTDSAEVKRLMDINFSCLTNWHPCKTKADILPTAWNEYTAEEKSKENSVQRMCSPDVVRVLSRESRRVVIGEVTKAEPSAGYGEVTVLLKGDFKSWNPHFPLAPENYSFSESLPMKEKLGDRYVLFFEHPIVTYRVDHDPVCTALPATAANVGAVRLGVAEDWADHNREFLSSSPGLGDLQPPTIDVR